MQDRSEAGDRPLSGRVAVITGGSRGIGAATARTLAEHGATVVVGYRTGEAQARDLVAILPGLGHLAAPMEVTDSTGLSAVAAQVKERFERLDLLVNSAGMTRPVPHQDLTGLDDKLFDEVMRVNVRGVFASIRAFAPLLTQTGGLVVNVSSASAVTARGSSVAYCASKAALDTMGAALARALGPEIRILTVSPGAVDTDFVAGRTRAMLETLAEKSPLGRVIEPEDVAAAILGCALNFRACTGITIPVTGGSHLG